MNVIIIIGIVLLVLWLMGFIFFRALGWLLHIALIIALIFIIYWLLHNVLGLF